MKQKREETKRLKSLSKSKLKERIEKLRKIANLEIQNSKKPKNINLKISNQIFLFLLINAKKI